MVDQAVMTVRADLGNDGQLASRPVLDAPRPGWPNPDQRVLRALLDQSRGAPGVELVRWRGG